MSEEGYEELVDATFELGNETCVGPAFGDSNVVTQTLALTPQEHARMHNDLRSSSKSFPHSFFVYPVHDRVNDPSAPLVALAVGMASWDVALRHLLPVGVNGIFAVIRNSCGQEYTYEISGPDAIFQGDGDLHEAEYSAMKVSVDLSPHQHPKFRETEGHCLYQMVSLTLLIYSLDKRDSTSNKDMLLQRISTQVRRSKVCMIIGRPRYLRWLWRPHLSLLLSFSFSMTLWLIGETARLWPTQHSPAPLSRVYFLATFDSS